MSIAATFISDLKADPSLLSDLKSLLSSSTRSESSATDPPSNVVEHTHKTLSIDDLWSSIVSNVAARGNFNERVEYILNEFGTALSCNRFGIGEFIEYAATDFLKEIGVDAEAVSSKKRIDILVRNVTDLSALSSKFVSTGSHVILYNAQRTIAKDMSLHPTILFLMDEWWLLVPSHIEKMGITIKDYIKSTGDSVQLSFKMLELLRSSKYPYILTHTITYDKESCPQKATSEVLYRIVKDLLNPDLDPVNRDYLEKLMKSLHCRKI